MDYDLLSDNLIDRIMDLTNVFSENNILYCERDQMLIRRRKEKVFHSATDYSHSGNETRFPTFRPFDVSPEMKIRVGRRISSIKFNPTSYETLKLRGWYIRCSNSKDGSDPYFVVFIGSQMYLYFPKQNGKSEFKWLTYSGKNIKASQKGLVLQSTEGTEKVRFIHKKHITSKQVFAHISTCFSKPQQCTLEHFVRSFAIFDAMEVTEETADFYRAFFCHPLFLYSVVDEDEALELNPSLVDPWIEAAGGNFVNIAQPWIFNHFVRHGASSILNLNAFFEITRHFAMKDPSFIHFKKVAQTLNNIPEALKKVEQGHEIHLLLHIVYTVATIYKDDGEFCYKMLMRFVARILLGFKPAEAQFSANEWAILAEPFENFQSNLAEPPLLSLNTIKIIIKDVTDHNEEIQKQVTDQNLILNQVQKYVARLAPKVKEELKLSKRKGQHVKRHHRISEVEDEEGPLEDASIFDSLLLRDVDINKDKPDLLIDIAFQPSDSDSDDDDKPELESKPVLRRRDSVGMEDEELAAKICSGEIDVDSFDDKSRSFDDRRRSVKKGSSSSDYSDSFEEKPKFEAKAQRAPHTIPVKNTIAGTVIPTNLGIIAPLYDSDDNNDVPLPSEKDPNPEGKSVTLGKFGAYDGTEEPPLGPPEDPSEPTVQDDE